MSFSITAEPALEKKIEEDLGLIRDAILSVLGRHAISILLTGGYGRGEGGIIWKDGNCFPVNDYDLVVVTKNMFLPMFLRYRSKIHRLGNELTEELGLGIDLALIREKSLRSMTPNILWYETQRGHYVVWGEVDIVKELPRWEPQDIPWCEGTRLLLNRGAMLLVAKSIFNKSHSITQGELQTILTAAWKAVLSWGDSVLLMSGEYDYRYKKREAVIQNLSSLNEVPHGDTLSELYSQAIHYKFFQESAEIQATGIGEWLSDMIKRHEAVFQWFEEKRLGRPIANWKEYATWVPKLPLPGSLVGRAKNVVRNVWQGGWPTMHDCVKWAVADQQERLLSSFPILLFQPTSEGLAWCTQALGLSTKDARPVSWERLVGIFRKAWH